LAIKKVRKLAAGLNEAGLALVVPETHCRNLHPLILSTSVDLLEIR
jgi:hypothetical protein